MMKMIIGVLGSLKASALFCLAFSIGLLTFSHSVQARSASLVVFPEDATAQSEPVQWAIGYLKAALEEKGVGVEVRSAVDAVPSTDRCIVVAERSSAIASKLLKQQGLSVPDTPEALGLLEGFVDGVPVLLACGSDSRGLQYAILELADRIECGIAPAAALTVPRPIIEQPSIELRSIYRTFTSDIEDIGWYSDREFWRSYLSELVKQRINRFSLTFGMGFNKPKGMKDSYLFFVYPFLFDVPGYDIRAINLPDEERDQNLEMLQFISDEAVALGLDFQLGLWSHGRDWENSESVNYPLEGLTKENHAPYCRDALALLLKECPSISGVTFRVHDESGVPDGEMGFWRVVFDAFKQVGRTVEIDMHGKGLTQDHLDWARATGMPFNASPKYVGEHMGLGYHPADIRRFEKGQVDDYIEPESGVHKTFRKFTRAGYADFIAADRDWGVIHRIWPGSNVLLLAGDPALATSYSRTTAELGTRGVERVDPLGFKGRKGTGYPGGRCAYLDKSLEPEYDFHKFLYTYRVWGRLLYNPETDPEVWQRFLRSRFGPASEAMETALANSSRAIHLITTAHGPATDCTRYWPEMYTNQPIVTESDEAIFIDNLPPRVFGNVSPHDPQLFSRMNEFASALLAGEQLAKYSPLQVAQWLDDMADTATRNLKKAESLIPDREDVDFRRFYHDIKIQCGTARFFAAKMRAAVLWHLYLDSQEIAALREAVAYSTAAREVWVAMAEAAALVYVENVSFGNWETQSGHWVQRIPRIDADLADMQAVLEQAENVGAQAKTPGDISDLIKRVKSRPTLPRMEGQHVSAKGFEAGSPIEIAFELAGEAKGVNLYYRQLNQAVAWQMMPMEREEGSYKATIPAEYTETRYPMQYYFAIDLGEQGEALFPGLDENLGSAPYFVILQSATSENAAVSSSSENWISLFDGESLEGWHVASLESDKEKGYWRVVDGTIECDSMGDKDHDYVWLCTDEEYDNFELSLKFQAFRENIGNSGVQVRSRYDSSSDAPRGGWLDGPQVDLHPRAPWRNGLVYDETRDARGWIYPQLRGVAIAREYVPSMKDEDIIFRYEDEGDGWNELKIVCDGTKIKSTVNGVVVCDQDFAGVIDSAAHEKYNVGMDGHIALQIHAKAEVRMRFKEIELRLL